MNFKRIILILIILLAAFLRFWRLDINPPGINWDETVFGYDAYSILKTGHDHHGIYFPLFFESFGDWKLPVYHYLLVPSIAIFGLNEFAVRFPSAFLGTLTVGVFYLLVQQLLSKGFRSGKDSIASRAGRASLANDGRGKETFSLLAALMLTISPWHIQFSRGGFESTVGLFFVVAGVYLFLLGVRKEKSLFLTFAFLLFTLSMYSYHAYRIFTPILFIAFFVIYFNQIRNIVHKLIIPAILSLVLILPLLFFTFSPEGKARAISQSAFDKGVWERARLDYDQKSKKPLRFLSKYLYQEPFYYLYIAVNNYFAHFSPTFLFTRGDSIGRHSQVDMGQIYLFDGVFLIAVIASYRFFKNRFMRLMLVWLLLAPVPAMIVNPAPHAYRTFQMAIPLAFFSALGTHVIFFENKFLLIKAVIVTVIIYSFLSYTHLLFLHYPKKFAADWQDGYWQMVEQIKKYQDSFEKVYVTSINQVPYVYLLFLQQYDPDKFVNERGTRDQFGKYFFINNDVNIYNKGRILYVAPSWEKVDGKWLAAANDRSGRHIYSLWEIGEEN